ncbi:MAG TPA: prolipoprotein diacylglyceryl transferase family protein [Patescibacteria group bacterium]
MPLTFHLYGFIIGGATVVGLLLAEHRFLQLKVITDKKKNERFFWQAVVTVLVSGVMGARLWHVVTDWPIYHSNLIAVFKIWQGGLSILGAVGGGVLGAYFFVRHQRLIKNDDQKKLFLTLLDISVFGLPLAQAIGRLGNYINQELYGLPTDLPWALTIDGVSYHPLWAYEALLTVLFGSVVWLVDTHPRWRQTLGMTMGQGHLFLSYIFYYSLIRFWLDFLRPDKAISFIPGLGINQLVLLGVLGIISVYMLLHLRKSKWFPLMLSAAVTLLILGSGLYVLNPEDGQTSPQESTPTTAQLATLVDDRQRMHILIGSRKINVEVVNTPASITQGLSGRSEIGSEGMLFLFGEKRVPQFWMKDMQFDLDLVWISDNTIVGITENVPHPTPGTQLVNLPHYRPPEAVDAVLEIPAGMAQAWGLKPGDPVVRTQ